MLTVLQRFVKLTLIFVYKAYSLGSTVEYIMLPQNEYLANVLSSS